MDPEHTPEKGHARSAGKHDKEFTKESAKAMSQEYVESIMRDPGRVQEWLGEQDLIYGGLIGVGIFMVQPFLVASSLDLSATVSVVAFALAIPLLAALVLLNRQEAFRRRFARSALVSVGQGIGQLAAVVGVVAGFWHIHWFAGVVALGSGILAVAVHSAGYTSVDPDLGPLAGAPQDDATSS